MILNKIKLFDARYGVNIFEINEFLDSIETLNVDVNFENVDNSTIVIVKYQLEVDQLDSESKKYDDTKLEVEQKNPVK